MINDGQCGLRIEKIEEYARKFEHVQEIESQMISRGRLITY